MGKGTNRLEAITQQNELLAEQNALLREQNELLRRSVTASGGGYFIKNIDRDEIRSGFLVTSQRKKLWNVQIGLIQEFARICKKHNLRWFAYGGTLLGAVRHKGFIPWDDDVDIAMFRPDYEKFQRVAAKEIQSPYFLDVWYNYRIESEGASLNDVEGAFQFITAKQEQSRGMKWLTQWPSIRLRDSRTTIIEFHDCPYINQGIWIDIFPLDPSPPFATKEQTIFFETARVLLTATSSPARIKLAMANKQNIIIRYNELEEFLKRPYKERGLIFDNFMSKNYFVSKYIGKVSDYALIWKPNSCKSIDFSDIMYLPFEKIEIPVPVGYESNLTDYFGDWRKLVYTHSHAQTYSADISWEEYMQQAKFK